MAARTAAGRAVCGLESDEGARDQHRDRPAHGGTASGPAGTGRVIADVATWWLECMAMSRSKRSSAPVTSVNIAELKNRLSHYLRRVQSGETVLVRDRDRVIARIDRVATGAKVPEGDAAWLDRLERGGVVRRGSGLSRGWVTRRPRVGADVVGALLSEREEGR